MRLNLYYISKCNYKAFNRLCCPDRLTLWNQTQIRKKNKKISLVQISPEPESKAFSAPSLRELTEGGGEKTLNGLERSLRSSLPLHACCGRAQMHRNRCVCVERLLAFCRTNTGILYIHVHTGGS